MCCCSTRPARSRSATARPPRSCRTRRAASASSADAAQLASLADETPEGRSIVVLAKQKFGLRERDVHGARRDVRSVHRADADERCRPARAADSQGRGRCGRGSCVDGHGGSVPARGRRRSSTPSRDAARRRSSSPKTASARARRHRAERHRERRDQGALRRAAAHGHQDGDDHRRQPRSPRPRSPPKRASTTSSPKRRRRRS